MSQNSTQEPPVLTITEPVAQRLRTAVESANVGDAVVRFSLKQEGDAVAHRIELEQSASPGDVIFEQYGLTLVVEPQQVPMLTGAHFDYSEVDGQARLTVTNPNLQAM